MKFILARSNLNFYNLPPAKLTLQVTFTPKLVAHH